MTITFLAQFHMIINNQYNKKPQSDKAEGEEFTKGLSCPLQNALLKLHLKNNDNHHNNNKDYTHNNNNNTKSSQPDRAEGVRNF